MNRLLLFILVITALWAKPGTTNATTAPNLEEAAAQGQILVKLKPSFVYLNASGEGMRAKTWQSLVPALPIHSATAFSSSLMLNSRTRGSATGKSGVDMRLYHQLSFDPEVPVAEAIALLQKSGLVEVAEPSYLAKTSLIPNDPLLGQQYYVDVINAIEAWDITVGSNSVIIAIIDSGVDLDHPDLAENIYRNEADPIDGIDNDADGFVDNYWGWDFAGADYINIVGDNDPNTELPNAAHGTYVAGCAAAITDNGIGIAGIGFESQLMVLKHTADNDTRSNGGGYLINLLPGVIYAAEHGADVINSSYGSSFFSQIEQDVYKYAALEHDVAIIAAAGNENSSAPNYPSDYDYVLSVAATTATDTKANFSNYGYKVDMSAPGVAIVTTAPGGDYAAVSGTSFAAPIAAGAAALVKSIYPEFNGAQIAEVLRVTADPAFNDNLTDLTRDKMGRGRLDAYDALTRTSPSIRLDNTQVLSSRGDIPMAGEEAFIWGAFINFLWPANDAVVTLTSLQPEYVAVVEGTLALGTMGMLDVLVNEDNPFVISVADNVPPNTEVVLRLDYIAESYIDYQYIKILVNPTYFNLNENLVATTITGNGRIGYQDNSLQQGLGFVYDDVNMLFELGVIMAVSEDRLVNTVRAATGVADNDFRVVTTIDKKDPGLVSDVDIFGQFSDANAPRADQLDVEVDYRAFVWREMPYEKMIMLEYEVLNTGTEPLNGFYFGLFADWDINPQESKDRADWHAPTNTGYVYSPNETERRVAGIQVLSDRPNYWAIDNDASIADNPFGVYDGFSDAEKFRALSSGIGRAQAGQVSEGADVSQVVSAGPYDIPAGESVTIAFVLHGGSSIEDVLASAAVAPELYESTLGIIRPVTGILLNEIAALKVYPNPTTGTVHLQLPANGLPFSARVYNTSGHLISTVNYAASTDAAPLQLPSTAGMYLLEIRQGTKRSLRRILVQ